MLIKTQEALRFYKLAIEVERLIKKRNKDPVEIMALREKIIKIHQRCQDELQGILEQGDKHEQ